MNKEGVNASDWSQIGSETENSEKIWMKNFQFSKSLNKTKCMLCSDRKIHFTGQQEFVLKRHYVNKHPDHGKMYDVKIKRRSNESDSASSSKKISKSSKLSRGGYIKNCVMLAIFHAVSFTLFNAPPFRDLTILHSINAGLTINASNIVIFIALTAQRIRTMLSSNLENKMFSIKLDIATKHYRSVLGVNIQYYSPFQKKIVIRSLGYIELNKRHTSKNLQIEVYKLLDQFGINRRNIYSFTSDNGSNMIRLGKMLRSNQHDLLLSDEMRKMQEHVPTDDDEDESEDDEDDGEFRFEYNQRDKNMENLISDLQDSTEDGLMSTLIVIRCAAHTLQLAVYDVLKSFAKEKILHIRKVVLELKSSKFLDFMPTELKALQLNVVTRWNSLFIMFKEILKKEDAFKKMFDRLPDNLKKSILLEQDDFLFMRQFTDAFQPVYDCTIELQSEQLAMSKYFVLIFST